VENTRSSSLLKSILSSHSFLIFISLSLSEKLFPFFLASICKNIGSLSCQALTSCFPIESDTCWQAPESGILFPFHPSLSLNHFAKRFSYAVPRFLLFLFIHYPPHIYFPFSYYLCATLVLD